MLVNRCRASCGGRPESRPAGHAVRKVQHEGHDDLPAVIRAGDGHDALLQALAHDCRGAAARSAGPPPPGPSGGPGHCHLRARRAIGAGSRSAARFSSRPARKRSGSAYRGRADPAPARRRGEAAPVRLPCGRSAPRAGPAWSRNSGRTCPWRFGGRPARPGSRHLLRTPWSAAAAAEQEIQDRPIPSDAVCLDDAYQTPSPTRR